MADSKRSKPADLATLDGDALAARLALVKERVLDDAAAMGGPFDPTEMGTAKSPAQVAAELAETVAVLDECAVRLLGSTVSMPGGPDGVSLARTAATIERLRALIRAAVATMTDKHGPSWKDGEKWTRCPMCFSGTPGISGHAAGCPWPVLVAEAEKT